MTRISRLAALFIVLVCGLGAAAAQAFPSLVFVQGSGEFQSFPQTLTVEAPQALTLQWTNDQAAATGAHWQVVDQAAPGTVLASGEVTPAPAVGHLTRFSIAANTFLKASTAKTLTFVISIQPHNAGNAALGAPATVTITETPAGPPPKPVTFGPSAVFPTAVITNYDEKIGVVQGTQLHFAGGTVTLRVSNPGKVKTDPMWLGLNDQNQLMRQDSQKVAIPALAPGASQTVSVHMNAILMPPTSQTPEDAQYAQWYRDYDQHCGVEFHVVMDWRGPQAETPIGEHKEALLKEANGFDQPSLPICDATQCIVACDFAKAIDKSLSGNVVGYAYFVGRDAKFGSGGKARTKANDADYIFEPSTKITVASVSKLVTAIATVRLLDEKRAMLPKGLNTPIGPFLPSEWNPGSTVKAITFRQLLSQTSGIKDYGNIDQTYGALQSFYTQSVDPNGGQTCQNAKAKNVANPINPKDHTFCYSNYNFAILRLILPKLAGLQEPVALPLIKGPILAQEYVKLVQQKVFDPVGAANVSCSPPGGNAIYAYAYLNPVNRPGYDFGDNISICGAAGWYLTVEDMAKVMKSLNAGDGKILAKTPTKDLFQTMKTAQLGFDTPFNSGPGGYLESEKNGGWSANCDSNGNNCDQISTSVAVYGPGVIGILFMNSNIVGGTESGKGARNVLDDAYYGSLKPKK
ncbi:serine hydrolase domain-containing protein [Asticcacaulis solisilvae]|uniref:serine hydrolase domain-containing protein n=1 Tax=Asticcacaulis solisilvae TaxID=1217274 RepID=UPI003FD7E8FF